MKSVTGTYVGAKIAPFTAEQRKLLKPLIGALGLKIGEGKLHTTVIFSVQSVDHALIAPLLSSYKLPIMATVERAAAFDSALSDAATFVLELACPELLELHAACRAIGCTHTYPTLSPHVSLFSNVERSECSRIVAAFNESVLTWDKPLQLAIEALYTEPIEVDWVSANIGNR